MAHDNASPPPAEDRASAAIVSTAEWRADLEANGYWSDKPTAVASMRMLLERIESLEKDLLTAHLMVANDAHDAPGRITSAIRPFLAGVVERHGLDSGSEAVR